MIPMLIRRWAIAAVAVPLAAAGARKLSRRIETRRGSSRVSRALHSSADLLQRTMGRKPRRRRLGWR
ncbi:MAG TPA: hypothetical protein VGD43_13425 [Micromonospora sp.]